MAKRELTESKPMKAIRKIALEFSGVEEGESCVNRAFKAGKKTFVFLGMDEECYKVRLKLSDSLPEAEALAKKAPDCYSVGSHGWTLITLPHSQQPPRGLLNRWIDESFRLLAPKSSRR